MNRTVVLMLVVGCAPLPVFWYLSRVLGEQGGRYTNTFLYSVGFVLTISLSPFVLKWARRYLEDLRREVQNSGSEQPIAVPAASTVRLIIRVILFVQVMFWILLLRG